MSGGHVTSDPRPHLVVLDPDAPAPTQDADEVSLLRQRIAAGDFDDHLAELGREIAGRAYLRSVREALEVRAPFSIGDRVVVRATARPRYLHGERGTVQCWLGSRVLVQLDRPIGRFLDRILRCPPGVLEKLRDG